MKNDFSLGVTAKDGGNVILEDRVTGHKYETDQLVVINGRLVQNGCKIIGRGPNGCFFNPFLYVENGEYRYTQAATYFRDDGKTQINLNKRASSSKMDPKMLVIPTLVSNAFESGPRYLKFVCFGEDAMRIASAAKGSSVQVFGFLNEFTYGQETFKYLAVKKLVLKPKGVDYASC